MANPKHIFDFEGILNMEANQKNWKEVKKKLEEEFGELKIGIEEGIAETEAQKYVDTFNKVLNKAKLDPIGVDDLLKNFDKVTESITKAIGLINNIDTSVLKGIEASVDHIAGQVDKIAEKVSEVKSDSGDGKIFDPKQLMQVLQIVNQINKKIKDTKDIGELDTAIGRLGKSKSTYKGIEKILNGKDADIKGMDLKQLATNYQESVKNNDSWEIQYQHMLKYIKAYEAFAKKQRSDKGERGFKEWQSNEGQGATNLYNRLSSQTSHIVTALQNVVNRFNNQELVDDKSKPWARETTLQEIKKLLGGDGSGGGTPKTNTPPKEKSKPSVVSESDNQIKTSLNNLLEEYVNSIGEASDKYATSPDLQNKIKDITNKYILQLTDSFNFKDSINSTQIKQKMSELELGNIELQDIKKYLLDNIDFSKELNNENQSPYHAMDRIEAMKYIAQNADHTIWEDWFSRSLYNARAKIAETLESDMELKNAALNQMWDDYRSINNSDIPYEEFLNTPISLYRGQRFDNQFEPDKALSFSLNKEKAEEFGGVKDKQGVLLEIQVLPKDILGSPRPLASASSEAEVLVPIEQLDKMPEYQGWRTDLEKNKPVINIDTQKQEEEIEKRQAFEKKFEEAVARLNAQKEEQIDEEAELIAKENGALEDKLERLNELSEMWGKEKMSQRKRDRYEEFNQKEMDSGLTSKEEDRMSELYEEITEADEALEEFGQTYDKIILKLANGKKVEIFPDDKGLGSLYKFGDEYGESYNGIEIEDVVFERAKKEVVENQKLAITYDELKKKVEAYYKVKNEAVRLHNARQDISHLAPSLRSMEADISQYFDKYNEDPSRTADGIVMRMQSSMYDSEPSKALENMAQILGIEIPQAAEKAKQAVDKVNDSLEENVTLKNKSDIGSDTASKPVGDSEVKQQVSINSDELKNVLQSIIYNVKIDGENPSEESTDNAFIASLTEISQKAGNLIAQDQTLQEIKGALQGIGGGNDSQPSMPDVKPNTEEIDAEIEQARRVVKNFKEWLLYLDGALNDSRYETSGKKEATEQLRNATGYLVSYRKNPEQFKYEQYPEERLNIKWMKSYFEAQRQGVAQRTLDTYRTDVEGYTYEKSLEKFQKEREFYANRLQEKEKELALLQQKKEQATSGETDNKVAIDTEALKSVLNSITYNVKIAHDDTDKEANKIVLDDSTLKTTLQDVFKNILNPVTEQNDGDAQEPWALEKTLQTVKGVLDTIQTNTAKIGTTETQQTVTIDASSVLTDLTAIKTAVESINNKVVKGTKENTNASSKKTSDNKKTPTQKPLSTAYSTEKKETQRLSLKKFRTELETSSRLTDDLKKRFKSLAISLSKVTDGEGLAKWNEKLKQFKLEVGTDTILNKYSDKNVISTYQELIAVQKTRNDLEVQYEKAKDGSQLKQYYKTQIEEIDKIIEKQKIRKKNDEQEAKLAEMRAEQERKIGAIRASKADKDNNQAANDKIREQQQILQRLVPLYKEWGIAQAKLNTEKKGTASYTSIENNIADLQQQIALEGTLDDELNKQLNTVRDLAKAQKERALAESVGRKTLKEEIADAKKVANARKVEASARSGRDTLFAINTLGIPDDVLKQNKDIEALEQSLMNLDQIQQRLADNNWVTTDDDIKELNKATGEVNKYTAAIKQLINNYNMFNGQNSTPLNQYLIGTDNVKQQLIEAAQAAHNGKFKFEEYNEEMQTVTGTVKLGNREFQKVTIGVNNLSGEIREQQGVIKKTESFWESFKRKLSEISSYFSASSVIFKALSMLRQGVQYIREIDSALTELRKVTDATEETYDKFLKTAAKTADKVGSTIKEIVSSTADWARIGYSLKDATTLAETTAVLLNVSEFQSIDEATSALTSTLQAFSYTAEQSMQVVDVLNEVGKLVARR